MAVFAAVLVILIGGWQIMRTHDALLVEAERNAQILTRSLAQHAARTVEGVDLVLSDLADRVGTDEDGRRLSDYIERRTAVAPNIRGIAVIDAAGHTVAGLGATQEIGDGNARNDLRWHRDHADLSLRIDATPGRGAIGSPGLALSRRLNDADGRFRGIVAAELGEGYLQDVYHAVQIGAKGAVALHGADGQLLVRFPAAPDGTNLEEARSKIAPLFAAKSDVLRLRSPYDGGERIIAFEHVEGYPLVVSTGIALDDLLAGWRAEALIEALVLGLAALGLIMLALGLDRHNRRGIAMERAAADIDDRYRLLAEHSTDLITLKSVGSGERLYVSPSVLTILGWEAAEFVGVPMSALIHADDLARVERNIAGLTLQNPQMASIHRVVHKKGHILWMEAIFRLTAAGTSGACIVTTSRDVTTRMDAEHALSSSEQRYRALADGSSDMVQRLDRAARRNYVSPASRDLMGYEPSELLGTRPTDFMMPDDAARVGGLLATLLSGSVEQTRSIHRIKHKDGRYLWVEAQFRLIRDKVTGEPFEIVSSVRDVSERERLQQRLSETNRYLMMAEEIAHVGHWRLDLRENTVWWSAEVFRIYGLDPDTYKPDPTTNLDYYHPDDRDKVLRCRSEAAATGEALAFALRIVRANGDIRYVQVGGRRELCQDTGEPCAIIGAILDVTELTEAGLRLTEKSALLETTLDNMDQALVKVAADGTIELANRRFTELLGIPPDLVKRPRVKYADILNCLASAGRYGASHRQEADEPSQPVPIAIGTYEHSRPDGTVLEVRTVPVADGAVVSTYADITARRQAENAMRESEALYRIMAETTSDVITRLDLDFIRRYVSPASRAVLGFDPEEMLGRRPANTIHPDDLAEVQALSTRLVRGEVEGDRAVATFRALHKQGHWVWLEAGMNLLRDAVSAAPTSVICSLRDITERQRVARHLERAKAAAEQAALIKAEFVANMSHELRTPLTGMLGVHDLLVADPTLNEGQRRLVGLASESGRSLLNIVNDILDFSKIEAGQMSIERVPFDLRRLIENCCDLAGESAKAKTLRIVLDIEPRDLGWVFGDPGRLQQVLLNLITNAVKFTERGEIGIHVRYAASTGALRLDVVDSGIGIASDKIPLLFERFSQADASTARRYGGTGLGLAICKRLVELMDGRIGVESDIGHGSRFWFEVPMRPASDESTSGRPAGLSEAGVTIRHILLAEDNPINQEIISAMLVSRNHVVTVVADGLAAVEAARDMAPAGLILMDLQMPNMDGLVATRAIRQFEREHGKAHLPIIGLTANAMREDVDRCLAVGMDGHVAKPIDWTELFSVIERVMSRGIPAAPPQAVSDRSGTTDLGVLQSLERFIGRDRLASMLSAFVSDLERRLTDLDHAASDTLADEIHSLVSLSGQLGFPQLSRLCAEIELEARRGDGVRRLGDLRSALETALEAARGSPFLRAA